ncbi:hypothetical protein OG871_36285 [Kitasatospora sp. NBC_00374]|uniref:hypothetical protein n=1 Tax=Kitasatospora sp. NBC_00374 TaxID=2975964 RepID=UPI0030E47F15
MLDALVTTAAGALSATIGVVVGGIVTRRAQDRQWLRDQQLAAYQELFLHYAKFTMEIGRAHADRRGWDYDWGEWSAVLTRVSLVAPNDVATAIDEFGHAVDGFLEQVARRADPLRNPLSPEEFHAAKQEPARAQIRLVNAIRRSLGNDRGLPFQIGG